eukprot:COSAG03_NODE_7221_length_947_cov_1.510613_1_plen_149_part_00
MKRRADPRTPTMVRTGPRKEAALGALDFPCAPARCVHRKLVTERILFRQRCSTTQTAIPIVTRTRQGLRVDVAWQSQAAPMTRSQAAPMTRSQAAPMTTSQAAPTTIAAMAKSTPTARQGRVPDAKARRGHRCPSDLWARHSTACAVC